MQETMTIRQHAETGARWAAVALGISIPVSTAMDNVLVGLVIAFWAAGGAYARFFDTVRRNAVVVPVLLVVGLYGVGALYSAGSVQEIWGSLSKGAVLLLIPVMIPLFRDPAVREHAITGFLLVSVVIVALSFGIWTGHWEAGKLFKGNPLDPVVFKYHITQNVLMAFAAFLFALRARDAETLKTRALMALGFVLAAFNAVIMVPGRTGQLVLIVLTVYALFCWARRGGRVAGAIAIAAVLAAGFLMPSSALYRGAAKVIQEYREWTPGEAKITESIKQRLDFYRTSLEIVKESPVYGVGTGGFARAYTAKVMTPDSIRTDNPHNEYIMVASQFGLVGLGVWLFLFWRQWSVAGRLPLPRERMMARGLVIAVLTASLVSSTLMDHTEGLFFAWMSAVSFAPLPPEPSGEIA